MTQHSSITSRIARQLTLRRLELTAITSTVLAFVLTVALVDATRLEESNAIPLGLVKQIGWTGAGLLAIAVEAAAFALYRRIDHDQIARAGGLLIAAIGVADLAINIYGVAQVGIPNVLLGPIADPVAPVVLAAAVVGAHPLLPATKRRGSAVLAMASALPVCRSTRRVWPAVVALLVVTPTFDGKRLVLGQNDFPLPSGTRRLSISERRQHAVGTVAHTDAVSRLSQLLGGEPIRNLLSNTGQYD